MAMYLKNNERRLPTELQHHLCFICGSLFRERHEYQKHLIGHQSFALVYQIYNFDKSESERKANEKAKKPEQKPGRIGHAFSDDYPKNKGSSSLRQSEELEREMRYRAKARPRTADKLEKTHREERRQYMREKEREEELLAERERQRKLEAARKRRETRKRKLDEHTAMAAMRDQAIPIAKRKPPSRAGADSTPLVSPSIADEPCSSTPPEPPRQVLPRETASGFSIGPLLKEKCPYCVTGESFEHPVDAIEHIVDHGGSVIDVKLHFYEDDKFIATETQLTGEKCNVCDVNFDFPTQYYLHLLIKHRSDVTTYYLTSYPNANNVKVVTVMIYRMYPEHTIEFREIILRDPEEVEEKKDL
ncbi:Zinc finger C2H2 type [Trichostrongylus colubriformis]|uniref:Zinc finger C2H2 type n=1 Tax=Trichostrongylus colubriformis TaxID=6319 RepID=A0AAN8IHS8_TRICO